jgi:protein tyrosine phosphatase
MVVHCSAGIGRTGTFCTADTIFHHLASAASSSSSIKDTLASISKISATSTSFTDSSSDPGASVEPLVNDYLRLPSNDLIAHTVNKFRKQRAGFVQTSAQYHLLYEIVLLRLGDLFQDSSLLVNWDTTNTASSANDATSSEIDGKKIVE